MGSRLVRWAAVEAAQRQASGTKLRADFFRIAAHHGDTVGARKIARVAVATIRRWWVEVGRVAYPDAGRLLITADAGRSNSYRSRLWRLELSRLAAEAGIDITVCHFPPGTSKWNKIEHRLFSAISTNWRGRPLTSHEVIVDLIAATTTRSGLKVRAQLDQSYYPKGRKVTDKQLAALPIERHEFHGEWNYTIPGQRRVA